MIVLHLPGAIIFCMVKFEYPFDAFFLKKILPDIFVVTVS